MKIFDHENLKLYGSDHHIAKDYYVNKQMIKWFKKFSNFNLEYHVAIKCKCRCKQLCYQM